MSKAKSIRKKVLKKNKEVRKNTQGLPREKSNGAKMGKMMKEFNAFVRRKQYEENIRQIVEKSVTHEELGLPEEISGQDLLNFLKQENKPIENE